MAVLSSYFRDFLAGIRPTENQSADMKTGHETLRKRLAEFESLQDVVVSDFIQGSYRRSTAIRPVGDKRSDVDVIVVTNLDADVVTPHEALEKFRPFVEKHYSGKYVFQGRSIGISLSYVELDLVVTAAPSEVVREMVTSKAVRSLATPEEVPDWRLNRLWIPMSERALPGMYGRVSRAAQEEEWRTEALLIPDRDADCWEETDPLAQIRWTFGKSKATDGHYVNVVKALKWWRRVQHPEPEHPKGYPLEHIIGDCCPDGIGSVAEGIVLTLEAIRDEFADHVDQGVVPDLRDRGVDQNVLKRLTADDFGDFHQQASEDAELAREAYEEESIAGSARLWRELLGSKFPEPPSDGGDDGGGEGKAATAVAGGGYTPREELSVPGRGRFG